MDDLALARRLWAWLKHWVWNLTDALPPYHHTAGVLESKESHPGGKFYIYVSSARIEVDSATFDSMVVGENLWVRYTKGGRAVNIDRILPARGPG